MPDAGDSALYPWGMRTIGPMPIPPIPVTVHSIPGACAQLSALSPVVLSPVVSDYESGLAQKTQYSPASEHVADGAACVVAYVLVTWVVTSRLLRNAEGAHTTW